MADVTDYLRSAGLPWRGNQSTQAAERLPPALLERLAKMQDGQAMMLAAPGGARIVFLAGSQPAPITLDAARPFIEQALLAEHRQAAVKHKLDDLRGAADIKFFGRFAQAASAPTLPASAGPARPAAASALETPAAPAPRTDQDSVRRGLAGLK
jgi:hypothetical protein